VLQTTWLATGRPKLYCEISGFQESRGSPYNESASQTGATGFDRNLNDRRDVMPGYLMQLVKTRRETQLPITMNWLSLP